MGKLKLKGKSLGNICVILLVVLGIYYIVYHTDLFRLNVVEGLDSPPKPTSSKDEEDEEEEDDKGEDIKTKTTTIIKPLSSPKPAPKPSTPKPTTPKPLPPKPKSKEGFANISPAPVGGSAPCVNPLLPYAQNNCGPIDINQFFFDQIQFKPECCPSTYSSSMGCACMCPEQLRYLNSRGGNRTHPSLY